MRSQRTMSMATAAIAALAFCSAGANAQTAKASSAQAKRGEYLATLGGCHDCHTPKVMTKDGPVPDKSRLLIGHPATAKLPPVPPGIFGPDQWGAITTNDLTAWVGPWGTSFAANLTPDNDTGIGKWTADQFIKTIRTGKHLGVGRPILPPMPWPSYAMLNDTDLRALFAYLKSLKPVSNRVPEPIPPK